MNIKANWSHSIPLTDGSAEGVIFWADTELVPNKFGCYCFCNLHGKTINIIYIGKATNLRKRLEQQFRNNVKLMMALKNFGNGTRLLLYCELEGKSKEKLKVLETQLIKTAVVNGHALLNVHGAKRKVLHEIEFLKTNKTARSVFEKRMMVFAI